MDVLDRELKELERLSEEVAILDGKIARLFGERMDLELKIADKREVLGFTHKEIKKSDKERDYALKRFLIVKASKNYIRDKFMKRLYYILKAEIHWVHKKKKTR